MKTDLKKVLSISGQPGLFNYLAQAKNGIIAESFVTKSKAVFGSTARVTSLADISIYTVDKEVALKTVLENMKGVLGEDAAPSHKSDAAAIKEFFGKVLPDYDEERFYVSHMKKILEWYNLLKQYASLDFEEEDKEKDETVEVPESNAKEVKETKQSDKGAASAKTVKATSAKAAGSKAAAAKKTKKSVQRKAN